MSTGINGLKPRIAIGITGSQSKYYPGYQLRNKELYYRMRSGVIASSSNWSDSIARQLMKDSPAWFNRYVVRAWYTADDPYWNT